MAARAINARIETVNEKATFRDSFERRRCLIPADGFYEWERKEKGKLPHLHLCSRRVTAGACWVMVLVGGPRDRRAAAHLYHHHRPTDVVARLHDRMPVAIPPSLWDRWLDGRQRDPDVVRAVLDEVTSPGPRTVFFDDVASRCTSGTAGRQLSGSSAPPSASGT